MKRVKLTGWGSHPGAIAGAVLAVAGCTSLLGDFSSRTGSGDAGADATAGDGNIEPDAPVPDSGGDVAIDGPGDGPTVTGSDASDAPVDAPPPPISCGSWVYSTPLVLETLAARTRRVVGAPAIFNILAGPVRIVAGKNSGIPFTVYSVDRTTSAPTISVLNAASTANTSFASLHRSPGRVGGYTAVLSGTHPAGAAATYSAYVLPDSMASNGPIPNPYLVYTGSPTQLTPVSIHILPLQSTEIFANVENSVTSGGVTTYTLGAGIATPATSASLFQVDTSIYLNDFSRSAMFHDNVNGNVYILDQNDLASPGLSSWRVSDTLPADASAPGKRPISANSAIIRDIAENTTGGAGGTALAAADIAYEEYGLSGAFITGVTFRAGTVAYSGAATTNLNTWMSTDLPVVKTFSGGNVFNAPFGYGTSFTSGSVWVSDQIMLLGPGARNAGDAGNGGMPFGLNMLWMDASGTIHSQMTGANRLLSTIGDFASASATPIKIAADGQSATWAVVMVETKTDDAGQYDVVEYNELTCQ